MSEQSKPIIGVSACLLGQKVRFDGGHKQDRYLVDELSKHVVFEPICPEMALGLGTPRPALQLREGELGIRMVVSRSPDKDLTDQMAQYAQRRAEALADLDGLIVKKGSPSCGMERVPVVVNEQGYRSRHGVGLFTATFKQRWPLIPVEEEGRLNDLALRENFFERVFAYRRWKQIAPSDIKGFIEFHSRHKLMLMARGHHLYRELGRMVAGVTRANLTERRTRYIHRFMDIMAMKSARGSHVNVMQHIMGYIKQQLDPTEKAELLALFEGYRQQQHPLTTPLVMLRYHLRNKAHNYISDQHYLAPYPEVLAKRLWV